MGAQADHRPLRAHMGSSSPLVRAALLGNIIIVSPRSSLCHWLLCWAGISRVSPSPKLASRPQHCPSHRCLCPVLLASLPIVLPTSCLQHCPLHPCLALLASLLAAMPTPCPYLALLASLPTAVPNPVRAQSCWPRCLQCGRPGAPCPVLQLALPLACSTVFQDNLGECGGAVWHLPGEAGHLCVGIAAEVSATGAEAAGWQETVLWTLSLR